MFTGIVEALGNVVRVVPEGPGRRLVIAHEEVSNGARTGDSIAINGCCLTVVERAGSELAFQAGPETLARTNLGSLAAGDRVNLERSLAVGDRLGGHFVQGHVDATAEVARRETDAEWEWMWFAVPREIAAQLVAKCSVAVDGVSLTVVEVAEDRFSVQLIPHTLEQTTLGVRKVGDTVNVETDILGKYVWQFLKTRTED